MNKERFHNELAMRLGYERIVKDNRITINVDDSDDPWVTLKFQGSPEVVRFKASGKLDAAENDAMLEMDMDNEIKCIIDAAYRAFLKANEPF